MKPEKFAEKIFDLGTSADRVSVGENYVVFDRDSYDSQRVPFKYVANALGEYTIGGLASAFGMIREKLRNPIDYSGKEDQD